METIHATSGVTGFSHKNANDYEILIDNFCELYQVTIPTYHIPKLADNMAKIADMMTGECVVCTSDRLLGDIGVVFTGGIKRAFSEDVFSTIEQRQATLNDADMTLTEHVQGSRQGYWSYPEYWVAAKPSHIVVSEDVSKEFKDALSQLVGRYFGLLVK